MKGLPRLHRKPMLLSLGLAGALAVGGTALAQPTPSTNPTAPSPSTSPAGAASSGPARSSTATAGMTSPTSTMPARSDSADSAWQKLGSKGYVTKDDVKDLSGFSFEAADANHDGRLTQDEFRRAWQAYAAAASPSTTAAPATGSAAATGTSPSSASGTGK